jgi:hypothetical protein
MTGRLARQIDLTSENRAAMHRLLDAHFKGVSVERFSADLAEKNWAILLEDGEAKLAGFSTLLVYETAFRGDPVSVVYSGDTIVRQDAWGSAVLPRTWIASVNRLRSLYPRGKYYWLLITSGFRTYRFLPLFWNDFFPRHDAEIPPHLAELRHHLAAERFGRRYDARTGIARFDQPQALRPALSGIPDGRLDDPHVAFFAAANPGHARGDELVCITELSEANLTNAGRRMAGKPQPCEPCMQP